MAIEPCPDCGKDVSDGAWRCPHCGASRAPYRFLVFLAAAVMILAVAAELVG